MKSRLLILLISILSNPVYADKSYKFDDYTLAFSGFINHTYHSTDMIPHDDINTVLNTSLTNNDGYFISGQVSNNTHNPLRRLFLNIPLYNNQEFNSEFRIGRLNNPMGFKNTVINNFYNNQSIVLPLSTYDPRRYNNMPDITDGAEIKLSYHYDDLIFKTSFWGGKQVIDDPYVPIYNIKSYIKYKQPDTYGIKFEFFYDDLALQYIFSDTWSTLEETIPPQLFKRLPSNVFQQMHFGSIKYTYDDFTITSETAYKKINVAPDEFGTYLNLSYNIHDNINLYTGYSYGIRVNTDVYINDFIFGISDKIYDISFGIEYHNIETNKWYFNFNEPSHRHENILMTSISYNF